MAGKVPAGFRARFFQALEIFASDARVARMVHLEDRSVHVVTVLLYAAAHLAHVVVRKAHRPLPEGELLVSLVGEKADVEMLLREIHDRKCSADREKPIVTTDRLLSEDFRVH